MIRKDSTDEPLGTYSCSLSQSHFSVWASPLLKESTANGRGSLPRGSGIRFRASVRFWMTIPILSRLHFMKDSNHPPSCDNVSHRLGLSDRPKQSTTGRVWLRADQAFSLSGLRRLKEWFELKVKGANIRQGTNGADRIGKWKDFSYMFRHHFVENR